MSRIERGLVSPTVETLEKLLAMMNEGLVLDAKPIDWGHDLTLIQGNLERDVDQRLAQAGAYADFANALRDAGRAVSTA